MAERIRIAILKPPYRMELDGDVREVESRYSFHDIKLTCVICGADCWLVGHQNLVVDHDARTARIEGTKHMNCYHCRFKLKGIQAWRDVSGRDWQNLSLAHAIIRTMQSEARHARG